MILSPSGLRRLAVAAAVLAASLLSACGGVFSSHPASEDESTRNDKGLLGFWSVELGGASSGASTTPAPRTLLTVGRNANDASVLRVVSVTVGDDGGVESSVYDLATTTVADRKIASLFLGSKGSSCILLRYELPDADTIRVLGMEVQAVADDVKAGKVSGTAHAPKSGGTDPLTVVLDAATPALRSYLAARGDGIWRGDQPLILRRVRVP